MKKNINGLGITRVTHEISISQFEEKKLDKCMGHTRNFPADFGIQISSYMSKKYENHEKLVNKVL